MKTLDFLRRVTGDAGYYCTLGLGDGVRKQKFYSSHEDMLRAAELMDENGLNAYFALGTFLTDRNRKADNVELMRALYLDLDCGPEKDYPDQHEAMQALRRFVKVTSLPKPLVVNSGRGLHVYWPLTEPVTTGDWLPVATRLKAACAALDFPCDTTATTDAARVLRVPGTHNHKDNPPKPVAVLMDGDDPSELSHLSRLLAPHAKELPMAKASLFEDGAVLAASAKTLASTSTAMEALMGNYRSSFKLLMRKTAEGKGCAQIGEMVTNPADVSEPLWRSGLSIAVHCEEEKAIHWISKGHPEYDYRQTEVKARAIPAPHSCATFNSENKGICTKCPFWGKIKSPIVLGRELIESDPEEEVQEPVRRQTEAREPPKPGEIPAYPKPYFQLANKGVGLKTQNEDGDEIPAVIWHNPLYVVRRLRDPEYGEMVQMRHHLPMDGVRDFTVPLTAVTSKEEFRKVLSAHGVAAINKEVDALMTYTRTWVNELQFSTAADDANRQFGWLSDMSGFVLGDRVITADGEDYNPPSMNTKGMTEFFQPKGTLDGWRDAMAFYNKPGFELHQFVVCAGFGSALMKFLPLNAALIHLWSKDSGFGKTTVQHAALSAWGDPAKLILGETDTFNSKMNRADVMHSLPVCMDEITNIRPADASSLIYQITGGQQRNRMSASGNMERFRGDPWNLLFISTANCSLIDKVAMAKAMPKAEAQRVLEIEVSKLFKGKEDKEITDKFSQQLHDNYGHAGAIFVEYVMQNLAMVESAIRATQVRIDTAAGLGQENRFWSAAAATALTAGAICKQLGLLQYDMKALMKYVVEHVLKSNKAASAEMKIDPMTLVTDYMYENWGRLLQIKSTVDLRGKHTTGVEHLIAPEQMPRSTDIVGRFETDLKRGFLMIRPFKEWLAEQQMNYTSVFEELRTTHKAKKVRARLTKGTSMNLPATDVLEIDMKDVQLVGPGDAAHT